MTAQQLPAHAAEKSLSLSPDPRALRIWPGHTREGWRAFFNRRIATGMLFRRFFKWAAEAFVLGGGADLFFRLRLRAALLCNPALRATWRNQCRGLSVLLHEPAECVARLLLRHSDYQRRVEFRRNFPLSPARLQAHVNRIACQRREAYAEFARTQSGSRLLVSFHFGDYSYGLNALLCSEPPGRAIHVLSLAPGSDGYRTNIRHGFGEHAVGLTAELLHTDTSVATLSALLRRGDCTLVLFCDVSAEFGVRTAVRFLGRRAWFSRGPATLAVVNRVPLIPVLCVNDADQSWIDITPPLDPMPQPDENVRDCVDRLTQQLVTNFEKYFRASPEQWRYLHQLPLYFTNRHPAPVQG